MVTRHAPGAPLEEYAEGVRIVRAPEDPARFALATPSLLAWTMAFNHTLTRAALRAAATTGYDVIHAHDWLVTHTAVTLKEHLDLPLVATIHATEAGRHQGWLPDDLNRSIHSVEWWLVHEACRVLVCSAYMKWEVNRLLDVPGRARRGDPQRRTTAAAWKATPRRQSPRPACATPGTGPLIGYAGRLVYEKGVQHLVGAVPQLRQRHPGLRVVIAGDGPYRRRAAGPGAQAATGQRLVDFAGFVGTELPAVFGGDRRDRGTQPLRAVRHGRAGGRRGRRAARGRADRRPDRDRADPGVTGVTFPSHETRRARRRRR